MSNYLWPHGLQHARLLCLSPTPRACSNSCPLSQWCHSTISSSAIPSPPAFNLSQHQGLFKWVSSSHQVAKVLAFQKWSGPITSWQIDRETMETVTDFILGGSKITADGDCSHVIKRCLLLGRKVMTNLDSIFKSRDITLPTNVRLVKAVVFPVVMYGCESWTIKKAELWRIDAFELWYGKDSWESLGLQIYQSSQS